MPVEIARQRLAAYASTGALGVVADTIYRNCFWPPLASPTALFATGSSLIQVEGPPTPRNVIFPAGTVFLGATRSDCFFRVEQTQGTIFVAAHSEADVEIEGVQRHVRYDHQVAVPGTVDHVTELTAQDVLNPTASSIGTLDTGTI